MTKNTSEDNSLSRFHHGLEYNERDYEVLMQQASDARRRKREEIRGKVAAFVAQVLPTLKLKG